MRPGEYVHLGNGIPLVYANAMEFHPHTDDGDTYRMASRNAWIKAVFLCRKFRELTPLRVFSEFKIGFSDELIAFWWERHDYIVEEDRVLLRDLHKTLRSRSDPVFHEEAIVLFKRVGTYLMDDPI